MKTLTCDFCEKVHDLEQEKNPFGWGFVKLDVRNKNIGGQQLKLDVCDKCTENLKFIGSKDRAIEFLKFVGDKNRVLVDRNSNGTLV